MKKTILSLLVLLICFQTSFSQQVFNIVVAKDGTGDYTSLQDAFSAVPDQSSSRILVFIKNGKYKEKVTLSSSKKNVSLIGQSRDGVIISWDDYTGKVVDGVTIGTSTSYTLSVESSGFYGENFTVENTAGNVGQAVALRTVGDQCVMNNCKLLGFQDTHYLHSQTARQYYLNCYIEGATDFMFGGAIGYFDHCAINCLKGGQYITAPSNNTLKYGLVYNYCTITGNEDVADNTYYLGRPWKDDAKTVWLYTKISKIVKPVGWSVWATTGDDADNHLTGYFAEYNSMNLDGTPADISQRASWGKQLTAEEVAEYTLDAVFPGWSLSSFQQPVKKPISLSAQEKTLSWSLDNSDGIFPQAYLIVRNNKVIGFATSASYTDNTAQEGAGYTYYVQSVTADGRLSDRSEDLNMNGGANDITPPSIPNGLKAKEIAGFGVRISWNASSDDEGVKGYEIFRNNQLIASEEAGLFYEDAGLKPGTTYTYTIAAYDLSGNLSETSVELKYIVKYAWLDDRFYDWTEQSGTFDAPVYVNGQTVKCSLVNCQVVPTRADYFSMGFSGAVKMLDTACFTLPELPDLEKISFFAATEQGGLERIIYLQQFDGANWNNKASFNVGQGYEASSICTAEAVRSFSPVKMRLYAPQQPVYIRWIKAERYEPSNDAYPDEIPSCYTLLKENFNGGIWGTVDDAAQTTKELDIVILGVLRKIKVNAARVLPSRGEKTSAGVTASKGAIVVPKNYTGSLELPELPDPGNVTLVMVNGTSDVSKEERGLELQEYSDTDGDGIKTWTLLARKAATPGGADELTYTFKESGLRKLRVVNYSTSAGGGDVYLQEISVTTICENSSLGSVDKSSVIIYPNPVIDNLFIGLTGHVKFILSDMAGKMLLAGTVTDGSVNLQRIDKGLYILWLTDETGNLSVHKVVKK